MKKWLKILLSLNSLRKAFGATLFSQAAKFNHHLEIKETLESKNVLILAPHPDDESFGCGGTIRKFANSGGKVTVVYFCDGAGGVPENSEFRIKNSELASTRKKEAEEAGYVLGISEQVFLGYPDGHLSAGKAATKVLRDLIKRIHPDMIFLPSFVDNHPDHLAVNDILIEALKMIKIEAETWAYDLQIWLYEIWSPIWANRIVMINDVLEDKKIACEKHASQLISRGYDKAIFGLNQYRAEINNQEGFAEAFFATTPKIYQKLFEETKI